MMTRKHVHKEDFTATPEQLFALLVTPSSIRQWWNAARAIVVPQLGGTWAAAWGDDEDNPDYITVATICSYAPPHRIDLGDYRYYARTGPLPFDVEFSTQFAISATARGASLQVTQDGFPAGSEADEFLSACQKGWEDTFAGIRKFLDESAHKA